ncbi:MAG: flavin reductase family protein [Anaerolineaceae bacterium]|nr:flavin reductase family protein [Anaerolineaceae bacterium]
MDTISEAMRRSMRLWACGVTVVTTSHAGKSAGMTASSFTSISLEPPLILVCLHKEAGASLLLQQSACFGVSILGEEQEEYSSLFAGYTEVPPDVDRIDTVPTFVVETGSPLLEEAIAWMDCRVFGMHDGATHHVIIGEVVATGRREDPAWPLVYHNRAYRRFRREV